MTPRRVIPALTLASLTLTGIAAAPATADPTPSQAQSAPPLTSQPGATSTGTADAGQTRTVSYGTSAAQAMDVTAARDPRSPLAVVIHGGAWVGGSRSDGDIQQMAQAFRAAGYATASLDYRLSSEAKFPAPVDDVKTALRWLHAHGVEINADPSRIVVVGASAGGWLGSMLGATSGEGDPPGTSSAVNAVISLYGPTNFATMTAQGAQIPGSQNHDGPQAMEGLLLGQAVPSAPDLVRQANPISYLPGNRALPQHWLLVHGTADKTVPPGQSQELAAALTQAGITPQLNLREGLDHADPAIRDDAQTYVAWASRALAVATIQPVTS